MTACEAVPLQGFDCWTAVPWRDLEGCKRNQEYHSCPRYILNTWPLKFSKTFTITRLDCDIKRHLIFQRAVSSHNFMKSPCGRRRTVFFQLVKLCDYEESTAEQLIPEEIVKVASEIGKIIVAQDAWWIQDLLKFTQFVICLFCGSSRYNWPYRLLT